MVRCSTGARVSLQSQGILQTQRSPNVNSVTDMPGNAKGKPSAALRLLLARANENVKAHPNNDEDTRDGSSDGDPHANDFKAQYVEQAKADIKDMIWYTIFLIIFSITTLSGQSEQDIFFFGDHIRNQLEGVEMPQAASHIQKMLGDVATVNEIHLYLQGVFYPFLYTGSSFNGTYLPGYVLGHGIVVGAPRIGAVRVKPRELNLAEGFVASGELIQECSPSIKYGNTNQDPYGIGNPYEYNSLGSKDAWFVSTKTSGWYPPPGYMVTLPRQENVSCTMMSPLYWNDYMAVDRAAACPAAASLRDLQQLDFIDIHTRAVFVDLNVLHPILDRLCVVRIFFELLQSGGVEPYIDVDVLRPYPYEGTKDFVRLAGEMVVLVMVFAYIGQEVKRSIRLKGAYFKDIGSIPHVLNLVLFIVVWALRLQFFLLVPSQIQIDSNEYIAVRRASDTFRLSQSLNSFNMFLSWVKVFKYMSFMPQFAQLTRTLKKAASAVGGFFLILALVLVGSCQAFLLAFGTRIIDYRNLQESFYSLVRALLMDFDLQALREANLWLGPLFFGSFIILAVFVLLNMFIAIISDSYTETREELRHHEGRMSYGGFILKVLVHEMLGRVPFFGTRVRKLYKFLKTKTRQIKNRRIEGMELHDRRSIPAGLKSISTANAFARHMMAQRPTFPHLPPLQHRHGPGDQQEGNILADLQAAVAVLNNIQRVAGVGVEVHPEANNANAPPPGSPIRAAFDVEPFDPLQ